MWHVVSLVVGILTSDRLLIIILLTYLTWQLTLLPHHHHRGFLMELEREECWQKLTNSFFHLRETYSSDHLFYLGGGCLREDWGRNKLLRDVYKGWYKQLGADK
jgi:hypothetical protein